MKKILKSAIFAALCLGTYSLADTAKEEISIKTSYGIELLDEDRFIVDCTYTLGKQFLFFNKGIYSSDKLENKFFSEICDKEKNGKQDFSISELKELTEDFDEDDDYSVYFSESIFDETGSLTKMKKRSGELKIKDFDLKKEKVNLLALVKEDFWYMEKSRSYTFEVSQLSSPRIVFFDEIIEKPDGSVDLLEREREVNDFVVGDKKVKFVLKSPINLNLKAKSFTNTYDINGVKECIGGKVWIKKYGDMSGDKCPWIEIDSSEGFAGEIPSPRKINNKGDN